MNFIKAGIATAAVITCCLGNISRRGQLRRARSFRGPDQMCHSDSKYCKHWTKLAYRCELGQWQIDNGNYNTPFRGVAAQSFP